LSSPIQNRKDFWAGLIYIAFGLSAAIIAREYGMGTTFKMGPAYFPTVLGGLLVLIGLISVGRSCMHTGSPPGPFAIKGLLLVVASTLVFGLIVRGAGLVIALPVFVVMSSYASFHFRWGPSLALAAGLTLFCMLVFLRGLGVPLPMIGSWLGG